ncbi:MAG TPA: hypothetical protein VK966_02110 [Longimicrobiales bacterium]|nr:hypothetical protein [Longimicrobiales bacterium]
MMKRTMWAALAVTVAGLAGATTAEAQEYPDYRFDIGVFGGGSWYSSMLDDEHLGEDTDAVRYKAGWVTGAQLTWWAAPRFGIRANGAFTERPLTGGDDGAQDENDNLLSDINLWSVSGDLMLRPTAEPWMWGNVASRPFIALGVGGKNTNPAGDIVVVPGNGDDETTGVYFDPTVPTDDGNGFFQMSEFTLMGLAALGTDMRLGRNFGLRLEVGDRFWDATLRSPDEIGTDADEDVGKVTHEIYGQLGAHLLLGLMEPEVVAVAPAPPAPPAPAPEPEPVEESIMVCVIEEDDVRMVEAIYLPEQGDTLRVVNGTRQPIANTLPRVMMADDADWFVRGEPLQLELAPDLTLEYTTWQSGRVIPADDLAYLGSVRGLPVFAAEDDVEDFRDDLEELRDARMTNDLNDILDERADLRDELEDIEYLYVPLQPTGCVFQTLQQVEQVRKK